MRHSLENGGSGATDDGEYIVAGAELELVERRIAVLTERLASARPAEPTSGGGASAGSRSSRCTTSARRPNKRTSCLVRSRWHGRAPRLRGRGRLRSLAA